MNERFYCEEKMEDVLAEMAALELIGAGHMMPHNEAERQAMIASLKRKYAKTLRHYARYLSEYPYKVDKANSIRANRDARNARRRAARNAPRPQAHAAADEDDEDIVYPEGLAPPPRRRRADSVDVPPPPYVAPPPLPPPPPPPLPQPLPASAPRRAARRSTKLAKELAQLPDMGYFTRSKTPYSLRKRK